MHAEVFDLVTDVLEHRIKKKSYIQFLRKINTTIWLISRFIIKS